MFTRSRVRNAQIPEGTIFYHARPKPSIFDKDEKAVAVYARVSTKSEEQISSIENQTKYYKEKIAKNPNWTMQEIYADEGKTGVSMKHRDALKRMLQDAAEKKMVLSYDQRICTGQFPVSDLLGYRHTADGGLVIQEEEAVTVRFIFLARMAGYSLAEIAEILTEREKNL